ncbi:hypothetical protein MHU86_7662 [Fragilaria crotonensis]|nr:hypothetical protein MHU86_7662 [Fragilaria crotonensis]
MKINSSLLLPTLFIIDAASAFIVSSRTTTTKCATRIPPVPQGPSSSRLMVERDEDGNIRKGPLEFLLDPKPTKIPPELKDEIYKAESNTVAAKERQTRVLAYTAVAFLGISCAFLNVFLTELRSTVMEAVEQQGQGSPVSLEDIGWGWVGTNVVFQFLLANKIGGALALMGGAGSAMMVEAEIDSQRANAEKIWEELERRRNENQTTKKKKIKTTSASASSGTSSGKKKPSGAQRKRLAALSEVVLDDSDVVMGTQEAMAEDETDAPATKSDGVLGKLKGWYEQADSMAAAQALLLNKELEDKGVLEKITDETGLRVIGKEAAAKLQQEKDESKNN